jgi:hypothetical protein
MHVEDETEENTEMLVEKHILQLYPIAAVKVLMASDH